MERQCSAESNVNLVQKHPHRVTSDRVSGHPNSLVQLTHNINDLTGLRLAEGLKEGLSTASMLQVNKWGLK